MDDPGLNDVAATWPKSQALSDDDNLNTLTLCHYILGGVTAVFSCLFILHIVIGTIMIHHPGAFTPRPVPPPNSPVLPSPGQPVPFFPPAMGYLFVILGTIAVLGGWTLGGLIAGAGRFLKTRRGYLFILIMAGCNCAFMMPLGTVLGVFTFIVLLRPSVKDLFERPRPDA